MRVAKLGSASPPSDWLREQVAAHRAKDPLAPITVVSSSASGALSIRRGLGRTGTVNVHCTVFPRLAESLGAQTLATSGHSPITPLMELAIGRHLLSLSIAGELQSLTPHRATVEATVASLRRLRQQELTAEVRKSITDRGPLAATVMALLNEYEQLLRDRRLYDGRDLLHAAAGSLRAGRAGLDDVGPVIVHLPLTLSPGQCRLLNALDERVGVAVSLIEGGLPEALAAAERLQSALVTGEAERPRPAVEHVPPSVQLVTAPSPLEEVRLAVRRVLADCEAGTPLHRMAILHNDQRIYGDTLRDTLSAAGVPSTVLGGRPLSESHAGRGLLGLLRLRNADFSRVSVVTWLASFPRQHRGLPDSPAWDRLTREAGVVCGVDSWRTQLSRLAARFRRRAEETGSDPPSEARREALRRDAAEADQIAQRVVELDTSTTTPPNPTWAALSAWSLRLLQDNVTDRSWPAPEHEAAQAIEEVLAALPQADGFEPAPTIDTFIDTLERLLESRHRPEGRLGTGVVVGTVDSATGMTFARVHVLGMSESAFPSRPASDPFLPTLRTGDPLDDREERVGAAALALAAVCAGTESGGSLHLSTSIWDSADRPVYPSRWFVAAAGELGDKRVTSAQVRSIASNEWLTAVPSPHAGLMGAPTPLNVAERRLAQVATSRRDGHRLDVMPIAARTDLPLQRGLEIRRARWSRALTGADGNLADLDLDPGLSAAAKASTELTQLQSATGLQKWAECPYSYFLERVLNVQATNRPEDDDRWSLSALDKGSAVHAILEQFFRELIAAGRPLPGEPYTAADSARLREIADQRLDRLSEQGITGHPLVWATTKPTILADLETFLVRDAELRAEGVWVPFRVEQHFGYLDSDEASWDELTVDVEDGVKLRLRGQIDRIDVEPSIEAPMQARVLDYKTGSARPEKKELEADPVRAGRSLQLPLYARAVRTAHPGIRHIDVAYWYISTKGEFKRAEITIGEAQDARLTDALSGISRGIRLGAFPQAPGDETYRPGRSSWDNCVYCPFDRICPSGRDALHDRKAEHPASQLHGCLTLPEEDDQ